MEREVISGVEGEDVTGREVERRAQVEKRRAERGGAKKGRQVVSHD